MSKPCRLVHSPLFSLLKKKGNKRELFPDNVYFLKRKRKNCEIKEEGQGRCDLPDFTNEYTHVVS